MVARHVRRVSKMEAMNILGVSLSTVERMIHRGDLQVEREELGGKRRVWILLKEPDAEHAEPSGDKSTDMPTEHSPDMAPGSLTMSERDELITLRVQVTGLQDLSDFRAEQLKESELRFHQLIQQLELLTRALPAPPSDRRPTAESRWSWWPWRRRSSGR